MGREKPLTDVYTVKSANLLPPPSLEYTSSFIHFELNTLLISYSLAIFSHANTLKINSILLEILVLAFLILFFLGKEFHLRLLTFSVSLALFGPVPVVSLLSAVLQINSLIISLDSCDLECVSSKCIY